MFCVQKTPPSEDQMTPDVLVSKTAQENWAAAGARIRELPADDRKYFLLALKTLPVRTEKVVAAKLAIKRDPEAFANDSKKLDKVVAGVLEDFGGPCRGH